MTLWPSATLPADGKWMERNGDILTIADYPDLFAILGNLYGGDGNATFALPDDRGLVERGWDHGRGYDANRGFGTEQADAIRDISGYVSFDMGGVETGYVDNATGAFATSKTKNITLQKSTAQPVNFGRYFDFSASRVVPTAAENRMRNRAYLPIIKVLP